MKLLIPAVALAAATLFSPLAAQAQNVTASPPISVDGTADAAYGNPIVVQDTPTQFGDNNGTPSTSTAGGSELDGGYGVISNGTLYLTFAGNLESNFNHLNVFIDSAAGGQNTLNNNPNSGALNPMNGLTFDTNFSPDYLLDLNGGGNPYTFYVSYATIPTGGNAAETYLGSSSTTGSTTTLTGGTNTLGIQAALDNSNTAGVTGTTTNGANLVRTGIEFGIPLSAIGNPTGPINISAFINGGGNSYLSNQVLGGIGGGGNLASPAGVDFSKIGGNQFFTVTPPAAAPEPGSIVPLMMGALALGGMVIARRRTASVNR